MTPPEASPDRELEALELILRADAPQPAPQFARQMDARVAARFKRPRRRLGERFGTRLWIPSLAAAATAAAAVAVLAIAGVFGGSSERTAPGLQAGNGRSHGATVAARHVERTAHVTLAAARGGAGGVSAVARRDGGFVSSSNVGAGTVQIEVPNARLEAALADLARLGEVRSSAEAGHDMTAPYNAVEGQLGAATAQRAALVAQLQTAHGGNAATLRGRVHRLSRRVSMLGARDRDLRHRTSFSIITVTIEASSR